MSEYFGTSVPDASAITNTLKIFSYLGTKTVSSSVTLDVNSYGYILNVPQNNTNLTLPLAASSSSYAGLLIRFTGATGTITVSTQSGDSISINGGLFTTLTLNPGDTLALTPDKVSTWLNTSFTSANALAKLATSAGAYLVGYSSGTVGSQLDSLNSVSSINTSNITANSAALQTQGASVSDLVLFKQNLINKTDSTVGASLIGYKNRTVASVLDSLVGFSGDQVFTATAGQTTFTVSGGYNSGSVQVFVNGVKLISSDFTATDGSTVVLSAARIAGDIVEIIPLSTLSVGGSGSASSADLTAFESNLANTSDTTLGASLVGYKGQTVASILNSVAGFSGNQTFTATGGQTTFTISGGYTVGSLQVFANGAKLPAADYTATDGSTVVLATARALGDVIEVLALTTLGLYSASINAPLTQFEANLASKTDTTQGASLVGYKTTTVASVLDSLKGYSGDTLYTSIAGQTTFTVSGGYTVGSIQIFINGIKLPPTGYTASDGSTIVLNNARSAGDTIEVLALTTLSLCPPPAGYVTTTINGINRTIAYY